MELTRTALNIAAFSPFGFRGAAPFRVDVRDSGFGFRSACGSRGKGITILPYPLTAMQEAISMCINGEGTGFGERER